MNSSEEAHALINQLSLVLGQNLEKAQTLEDAIAMNNTGLPFDRYEEIRSKKQRSKVIVSKKEAPVIPDGDPDSVACGSGVSMDEDGAWGEGVGSTSSLEVLKVLSASPHIIFCCPKDGPLSYVLVGNSTAKGLSATAVPTKRGTLSESAILEAERNGSRTLVDSSSQGLEGVGGTAMKGTGREGGGGADSGTVIGMMRAASSNGRLRLPDILTQAISLQNLIKPADGELSSSLMDQSCSTSSNPASASTSTSLLPATSKPARGTAEEGASEYEPNDEDNDLQKFSKFASSLVGIDPLDPQGFTSNFVDGENDGGATNGKGSLDEGMDLSAHEEMPAVPEVPLTWLLHSNTHQTSGEEGVASQTLLTSSASENHCTYVHEHGSDYDWMNEGGMRNTEEDVMISDLPSSSARPCVVPSTRTVLGCQTPVCNGGQNREADVCEDRTAHTPNASTQEARTMHGMQSGNSGMESLCESRDDALLGVSLDLDPDSLQRLLQLSFSPHKSAARDSFGECSESDLAEGGDAFFSLSSLIGKPTENGVGSNVTSGEVAAVQPPHDMTFSYSLDPSSCNPTPGSRATTTSLLPSELPYALSLSSPSPNVVATDMDGANTSNDDVWDSWQHCNADSIRMWLKSTSEAGGLNEDYRISFVWLIFNKRAIFSLVPLFITTHAGGGAWERV